MLTSVPLETTLKREEMMRCKRQCTCSYE